MSAKVQVELAMGVWKVLRDDGPLYHLCGGRVYGDGEDHEGDAPRVAPYIWLDPGTSDCAIEPGNHRVYTMVVRAECKVKREAVVVMSSILCALADARPHEYIQDDGWRLVSFAADGTTTGTCVMVKAVFNVCPVGEVSIH